MKRIYLASFLTYILALAGCGGSASSQMTTVPTPTPAPTPGGVSPVMVGIPTGASFLSTTAYVPNPITVQVGTTIKWINNDNVAHTVSSQNNLWDSGDMEPGATYSRTFQAPGTFPYYCAYHPLMVGTITVQ
jgi:plastocyanin